MSPFVICRLSRWTGSLCLPSFVSQPGCLARLGFICLPLSPFICLPLSPSLDAWVDRFTCLPLSPFICRPLSPSLAGSLGGRVHVSPSFVSRSLPAWMPGTALWVDGFICLPLSPLISPVYLSPFVSLHLSPVVSQPGCLARLSGWTGSSGTPFVSLHLSSVVSQPGCLARLSGWTGSFVSLCLPSFVSRCLAAWMPGAALWVDGFICLPLSAFMCLSLSPSLDAWRVHLSTFVSQDV